MGQVMTLCTSDEADEHGYDKTTVEKASFSLPLSLSTGILVCRPKLQGFISDFWLEVERGFCGRSLSFLVTVVPPRPSTMKRKD